MKRIFLLSLISLLMFTVTFAQEETRIPQLVSFSAIVRDANNDVLPNTPIFVRLTFLAGGQHGTPTNQLWYETTTNNNGFMSLLINRDVSSMGPGSIPFETINWQDGNYWMKVEYKVSSGEPWGDLGTLELASSFYAFAARRSETTEKLEGFDFDDSAARNGNVLVYNATTQKWEPREVEIPENLTIPTSLSDLTNDVGYIITEVDPTVPAWAKTPEKPVYQYSEILNAPDLSVLLTEETNPTVPAWAKAENKPTYDYSEIQGTPTNVSVFTNDANYITSESQTLANVVALGNSAGAQIRNVANPTDAQDIVTKAYIDSRIAELREYILDSIEFSNTYGPYNGHVFVDLGLPSGLKWAACNIGASGPNDFGDYFAWGETTPKTSFTEDNYTYHSTPEVLPLIDDAAYVNWGAGWRMPTKAEFLELLDNCTWTLVSENNEYYYVATGSNGNSIVFPFAGFYSLGETNNSISSNVRSWLSTTNSSGRANYIWMTYTAKTTGAMSGSLGLTIRPVHE